MPATDPIEPVEPPTFEELLDWIEGRLTRQASRSMTARVGVAGPTTRRSVQWIEDFMALARTNPLPTPPPAVRQRLRHIFEQHHGRGVEPRTVLATLALDSRDDVVLAGVRGGAEVDESYQLAFAVDSTGVLIEVQVEPHGIRHLDGQVLSTEPGPSVWEATVSQPGGPVVDIGGDEHGSFSVRGVRLDASSLALSNGQVTIMIDRPLGDVR